MSRYRVTVEGRVYDVEVDDPHARPVTARVAGETFRVEVESSGRAAAAASTSLSPETSPQLPVASRTLPSSTPGQQLLTAPIPGSITKVVVSVGQAVQRGDPLLTIEAMKMFNVIRSPWAGTVAAVNVAEGKNVAQGELLVSFVVT